MYCLFSAAKTLDESPATEATNPLFQDLVTSPILIQETKELLDSLKALSASKLGQMQGTSGKLTQTNYERYQTFFDQPERVAAFMHDGHAYKKLNVKDFTREDLESLAIRLGILSGLYGVLRPFDKVRPYRLDPADGLKTNTASTVGKFWKAKGLTDAVAKLAKEANAHTILNVASDEFTNAIDFDKLENEHGFKIVHTSFRKAGNAKLSSAHIKYARGHLVRFVAKSKAACTEDLLEIDFEGIRLIEQKDNELVFSKGEYSESEKTVPRKKRKTGPRSSSSRSRKISKP